MGRGKSEDMLDVVMGTLFGNTPPKATKGKEVFTKTNPNPTKVIDKGSMLNQQKPLGVERALKDAGAD